MLEAAIELISYQIERLITIGWEKNIVSRVRFYRFFFYCLPELLILEKTSSR